MKKYCMSGILCKNMPETGHGEPPPPHPASVPPVKVPKK